MPNLQLPFPLVISDAVHCLVSPYSLDIEATLFLPKWALRTCADTFVQKILKGTLTVPVHEDAGPPKTCGRCLLDSGAWLVVSRVHASESCARMTAHHDSNVSVNLQIYSPQLPTKG